MAIQQQYSPKVQLGHCIADILILHSFGVQLQSEHLIVGPIDDLNSYSVIYDRF
jgi:hypothetical protein